MQVEEKIRRGDRRMYEMHGSSEEEEGGRADVEGVEEQEEKIPECGGGGARGGNNTPSIFSQLSAQWHTACISPLSSMIRSSSFSPHLITAWSTSDSGACEEKVGR